MLSCIAPIGKKFRHFTDMDEVCLLTKTNDMKKDLALGWVEQKLNDPTTNEESRKELLEMKAELLKKKEVKNLEEFYNDNQNEIENDKSRSTTNGGTDSIVD
jgi:hypothetical protein